MYVLDENAMAWCCVINKETGEKLSMPFLMGEEPTIDEETEEIVGLPTWDNLTNSHGKFVKYAAWEIDQEKLSLVFVGTVDQPDPTSMGAPYQKVKMSYNDMTDKQMIKALKSRCESCGKEEKGGKRSVVIRVYRKGCYCADCAAKLNAGKVASTSRYTNVGYIQHSIEKDNQAFLYADDNRYRYEYRDNLHHAPSYMQGQRKYELVKVVQEQEDAA